MPEAELTGLWSWKSSRGTQLLYPSSAGECAEQLLLFPDRALLSPLALQEHAAPFELLPHENRCSTKWTEASNRCWRMRKRRHAPQESRNFGWGVGHTDWKQHRRARD